MGVRGGGAGESVNLEFVEKERHKHFGINGKVLAKAVPKKTNDCDGFVDDLFERPKTTTNDQRQKTKDKRQKTKDKRQRTKTKDVNMVFDNQYIIRQKKGGGQTTRPEDQDGYENQKTKTHRLRLDAQIR